MADGQEQGGRDRTKAAPIARQGTVQAVTRALRLLTELADRPAGAGLSELAAASGLAVSTAHRLLTTLEGERFVRFDGADGVWKVGVAAFSVGSAFRRSRDLATIARPFLRRLMEVSGETANLYLLDDGEAVCVAQVECRQMMRAISQVGGRVRLHCSGAGKALMAYLDDADVARVFDGADATPSYTPATITDLPSMRRALTKVRRAGFAVDDEEHVEGLRCLAAPIFDETRRPIAAMSISGPSARIGDGAIARLGGLVAEVAACATAEYGGSAP